MSDFANHKHVVELIENKKVLIFDFDGVLAETFEVKTEAFASLYKQYGREVIDYIVEHHRANGGMSDFEATSKAGVDFVGIGDRQSSILLGKVSNLKLIAGFTWFTQ